MGFWGIEGALNIPHGVTLQGTWKAPIGSMWKGGVAAGTNFMTMHGHGDANADPFILMSRSSSICGIAIYYPKQTPTNPPVPYPWAISADQDGHDCRVEDIFLANCYQGINFGNYVVGRHLIRNIYGDILHRGIFVNQCLDVGRIENIHFWPYWGEGPERPVRQYVQEEAIAFDFGRSDWQMCTNTFCWGYGIGYRFKTDGRGEYRGSTNGNFLGIAADACSTAVKIEAASSPGLLITNGQFVAFPGEAIIVDVAASNRGTVRFVNSAFWGPCNQIARIKGEGTVGFSDCTFVRWARDDDRPAIECAGGKLLVRGCEFKEDKLQVVLTDKVQKAVIGNNILKGNLKVKYPENLNVSISGNI